MAHIKCRYIEDEGYDGNYEFAEFEKTVKWYELDGQNNLNLRQRFIGGDEILYLEIDGRVIVK